MRYALAVLIAIFGISLFLLGCGDGGRSSLHPPDQPAGTGSVSFTVNWPERAADGTRVIPPDTETITVSVLHGGISVGWTTITRPESTGTVVNIPAGTVQVIAIARNAANEEVARGQTAVTVVVGQTVSARLVLYEGGSNINPTDGAAMVWVPGGTFTMGTEYGAWWDQPYTQQVTLTGYWIYKYEVTVAQYRAFCTATGRALPHFPQPVTDWGDDTNYSWEGMSGWDDARLQQHPIVNVTWYDARDYAAWAGVSLPTEAQWEFAARGTDGRNYPWGGLATAGDYYHGWDQTRCANYYNSYSQGISTWPVGSFPSGVSPYGAHDMAGNVFEWCADWRGNYSSTPVTNPTGPATGTYRVLRGGSWGGGGVYDSRCADRVSIIPSGWDYSSLGFRCVSVSPGP